MPLLKDIDQSYINTEVIYIGSNESVATKNGVADFRYDLPSYYSDVVAMEMIDYQVPIQSCSQFIGRNKIDFRLRNTSIYAPGWKTLVATIPETIVVYNSPQYPSADILTLLYSAFKTAIDTDPDFGGKVDIVPYPEPTTTVTLLCRTLAFPPLASWPGFGSTECEFLFGTGVNKESSAALILGFDEVDYTFTNLTLYGTLFKSLSSPRETRINTYRYLDVFIEEFDEYVPFYRIFLPTIPSVWTVIPETSTRCRLLDKPIRHMKRLTFRLRLNGDVKPTTEFPFFFNIKLYKLKRGFEASQVDKDRSQLV